MTRHTPLGIGLPVVRRRRNLFRPQQGIMGAQEPLILQIPQFALYHGRRARVIEGDESHRHPSGRRKGGSTGFVRSRVHCASRRQEKTAMGSKGESNGGMRKGRQPGEPVIFIGDPPQRADPTNVVTSQLNAPHNGLFSPPDRTLQIPQATQCHNNSLVKRRVQRARKQTATTLPSMAR